MCEHRTAQCVGGYVSMLRRCGDTTGHLDLLRTKPHLLDWCQWMSIRLVQWIFIDFKDTFETGESFLIILFNLIFFTYHCPQNDYSY